MIDYLKSVHEEWLFEEEMEEVLGLVFKVRNSLGAGRIEEIYHQALVRELDHAGIPTQSKPKCILTHRGMNIHTFEPDIIVCDEIILELKMLQFFKGREFPSPAQAQILQYLKFQKMRLGALINFAPSKVGICRMIFAEKEIEFEEKFDRMMPFVGEEEKQILRAVLKHIRSVANQYGLGYSETIYRKLLAVELEHHGIKCLSNLRVPATYSGEKIGSQETGFLLVEDRFLINVRALLSGTNTYDFLTTRTFLEELGLKVGWVVNFGTDKVYVQATVAK